MVPEAMHIERMRSPGPVLLDERLIEEAIKAISVAEPLLEFVEDGPPVGLKETRPIELVRRIVCRIISIIRRA